MTWDDLINIKLGHLLRYGFSGGVGILSYVYVHKEHTLSSVSSSATVLALAGLVIGSVVYSGHRAFAHRLLDMVASHILLRHVLAYVPNDKKEELDLPGIENSAAKMSLGRCLFFLTETQLDLTKRRWQRQHSDKVFQRQLDEWAGQVNLLYGSGWCVLLAVGAAWFTENLYGNRCWVMLGGGIFLLLFGFFSHIRHSYVEIRLHPRENSAVDTARNEASN